MLSRSVISTAIAVLCIPMVVDAASPQSLGSGSYLYGAPTWKSKSDSHEGSRGQETEGRELYLTKDADGTPIPSNDWWTDLIINRFSGALWSYPQMLYTSEEGVQINYPSYWQDNGEEVKSKSWLKVSARDFQASAALASGWHDWDVEMQLPDISGHGAMNVTMAQGQPITWFEFSNLTPTITFSTDAEVFGENASGYLGVKVNGDLYGIYYPASADADMQSGELTISDADWVSIALLKTESDLDSYNKYATSIVRSTTLSWQYNEADATIATRWEVQAENLRDISAEAPVMQGFLPHVYKHMLPSGLTFSEGNYLTPRGTMKTAVSSTGIFEYSYRFAGVLPYMPVPEKDESLENPFDPEVMKTLMQRYAEGGTFGADTYWGGKGLEQMALNMMFAKESGETQLYEMSREKLREVLVNWLTYTPGEDQYFFSYYPRWGSMVGYDVSYDSDAFNDHHFHFGYFVYAGALLCLEDPEFKADYGEMLKMIAKDYANYDREDNRFPFLRTLSPWFGHSFAGGFGDHLNDNGNGQESTSESMQGWGAVYMLGVALGDKELRDAGIFGWSTESLATREYWFDVDHIYPDREHNIDYTKYTRPYNSNITCKGIGWWTWFSGDYMWMHSIQWMPVSPLLSYLSRDLNFARWDYETMMSATDNKNWFEANGKEGTELPLADQSLGNVVLCYLERFDPDSAAAIFDEAREKNLGIYRNVDTGHISYYTIHSHRTYGDFDFSIYSDCPTATAFTKKDGTTSYVVYNPDNTERTVNFYKNGASVKSIRAAGGKLTAYTAEAVATEVTIESEAGFVIPQGETAHITSRVLDQYGASVTGATSKIQLSADAPATIDAGGKLTIGANAAKGTKFTIKAVYGDLVTEKQVEVNEMPKVNAITFSQLPEIVETGVSFEITTSAIDQYGKPSTDNIEIVVKDLQGSKAAQGDNTLVFSATDPGKYTITATSGEKQAVTHVVVVAPLPNIALGKTAYSSSEENAGTLTTSVNDGDHTTRWGSAHTDNEWVYLDLGKPHFITASAIDWEAAYASEYALEITDDPSDENSWQEVRHVSGITGGGINEQPLGITTQYIRMRGIHRGLPYGYSILEWELRGFPSDQDRNAITCLYIDAPEMMDEGETIGLTAYGASLAGELVEIDDVIWSCELPSSFDGNMFTPLTYGHITLNAATPAATARGGNVPGGLSASTSVFVGESIKLRSIAISGPATMLEGDSIILGFAGKNQFGGIHDLSDVKAKVLDKASGTEVATTRACYNTEEQRFFGYKAGDYTLKLYQGEVEGSIDIIVEPFAEANLALNKRATASSNSEGSKATNINDGDNTTRWESAWQQDMYEVEIDLSRAYILNRMQTNWEGAFAKTFKVLGSLDGSVWEEMYDGTCTGAGEQEFTFSDTPARYVKLRLTDRALEAYGVSIWEWRVFGKERYTVIDDIYDVKDGIVNVYDMQGRLLRRCVTKAHATDGLQPGIYIIGQNKIAVK